MMLLPNLTLRAAAVIDHAKPFVGWYMDAQGMDVLDNIDKVDLSYVTHVYIADRKPTLNITMDCHVPTRGAETGKDGDTVMWSVPDAELTFFPKVKKARDKYGFKIMLMLGGWGSNLFGYCLHEEQREKFVDSLVEYVEEWDIDGIDFDWEHPGIGGSCDHSNRWPEIVTVSQCASNQKEKFDVTCLNADGYIDHSCCTNSGVMCKPIICKAGDTSCDNNETNGTCWLQRGVPYKDSTGEDHPGGGEMTMCGMVNKKGNFRAHYKNDWDNLLQTLRLTRSKLKTKSTHYEVSVALGASGNWEGCQGRVDGRQVYGDYSDSMDTMRGGSIPCDYPDVKAICDSVDHIELMMYDLWGTQYERTDHHSPFHCDERSSTNQLDSFPFLRTKDDTATACSPRFTIESAVNWLKEPFEPHDSPATTPLGKPFSPHIYQGGCDPSKITIGLPVYGKTGCNVPAGHDIDLPGLWQKPTGTVPGDPYHCEDWIPKPAGPSWAQVKSNPYYIETVDKITSKKRGWYTNKNTKGELIGTYWYDHGLQYFMTIDTPSVVHAKTRWLRDQGIAGYFFWNFKDDTVDHEINRAAYSGWTGGFVDDAIDGTNDRVTSKTLIMVGAIIGCVTTSLAIFLIIQPWYTWGIAICGSLMGLLTMLGLYYMDISYRKQTRFLPLGISYYSQIKDVGQSIGIIIGIVILTIIPITARLLQLLLKQRRRNTAKPFIAIPEPEPRQEQEPEHVIV